MRLADGGSLVGVIMRFSKLSIPRAMRLLLCASLIVVSGGCSTVGGQIPTPASSPVPPAAKVVWSGSYVTNIQPIFDQHCVGCHGPARAENGLRLDSYDGVMKGTQYGPVVVPGSPTTSALESVVIGTAALRMPHGEQRLTDQEVQNITLWIQAGTPK